MAHHQLYLGCNKLCGALQGERSLHTAVIMSAMPSLTLCQAIPFDLFAGRFYKVLEKNLPGAPCIHTYSGTLNVS